MTKMYEHLKGRKLSQAKRHPQRVFLVHVTPILHGATHFLVLARTLEDAWMEALECPRRFGTAPRLGGVIEGQGWPGFMREKLPAYCDICNGKALLLADHEARTWAEWVCQFEERSSEVAT